MIEDLKELCELLEEGWQLAVTKGMAGTDVSCNVTNQVLNLISDYLEGQNYGRNTMD